MNGISAGSACFLVSDESLKTQQGDFWKYLRKEGFKSWGVKGRSGKPWVYINVNTMIYAPGVSGVPVISSCIVSSNPDNALSIYEFKVIWEILRERKLRGKKIIVANKEKLNELINPPAERTAIISLINNGEKEPKYRNDNNNINVCRMHIHVPLPNQKRFGSKEISQPSSNLIDSEDMDNLKTFLKHLDKRTELIVIHSEYAMNANYQPILYAIASAIEHYLNIYHESTVTVSPSYEYSRNLKLCDEICGAIGVKPIEVPYSIQKKQNYMSRYEYEKRVKKELYYSCGSSKIEIDAELAREKDWFWSYYENADGDYEHAVDLAVTNFSQWC